MEDFIIFIDVVAWIVFLFQMLSLSVAAYEIHKKGNTDVRVGAASTLLATSWVIYRLIT